MKNERQQKIKELISSREVATQEELTDLLNQSGYRVTQATISRDIREMKITKMPIEKGRQRYVCISRNDASEESLLRYCRILKDALVSMDTAQNILVIRTNAGMAMAVAAAIDGIHIPSIVGSLAGDDTVFCAVKSAEEAEEVMIKIGKIING
ncbi:MAG: arginine repressor [Lachnospiraceae bacterium]|nr:arginine repressor [Lachnospiraceae bacterium]